MTSELSLGAVEPGQAREWLRYDPASGECAVCRRGREPQCRCEAWRRIRDFLEEKHLDPLAVGVASGAWACKDCCIGKLDGHGCPWWILCWSV